MPCDTIQTNSVVLNIEKMAPALLANAIKAIGGVKWDAAIGRFYLNGQGYVIRDGKLTSTARDVGEVADRLKRGYSAEVVKYAAIKNGWQIKQTGEFAYNVIRS